MSTGVFLARMQPLHNAHLFLVEEACKENDKVVVMLGSSNKKDMLRNPFSIELRERMLKEAIEDSIGPENSAKIKVYDLPDWSKEDDVDNREEWGSYLYYNIVARANTKDFTMYYSDDPTTIYDWFNVKLCGRIKFRFFKRKYLFNGLSASRIREAFINNDIQYITDYCPDSVVSNFEKLRDIWLSVMQNPKDDFTMK